MIENIFIFNICGMVSGVFFGFVWIGFLLFWGVLGGFLWQFVPSGCGGMVCEVHNIIIYINL